MSKTVVLVDDDQDDLDILKDAIAAVDATLCCICFVDPADAIHALHNDTIAKPDFVFTDINMPGMTGDRFLQELRANRGFDHTVITVLSTSMPKHMTDRLRGMGADHTFEKPVHFKEYDVILKRILQSNRV